MLNGYIDRLTAGGFVQGWAHQAGSPEALTVAVICNGETVAQAVADQYRKDLLAAGMGHGHHAFSARLSRAVAPGEAAFELVDAETGAAILPAPVTLTVPRISSHRRLSVEDLLSQGVQWTDEEVLDSLDALNLDASFRQMGAKRFVDAVFQFALGRGADAAAAISGYTPALLAGRVTPAQVLIDVVGSEERGNRGGSLPSPHENGYPFVRVRSPAAA